MSVLVVSGSPEDRLAFELTRITIRVEALEPAIAILHEFGAQQLEPIQATPVGWKTRFRHVDGLVVEFVENSVSKASQERTQDSGNPAACFGETSLLSEDIERENT